MMTTVRAHFDGNVFVPEERVDMPAGTPLRVSYERVVETSPTKPGAGEPASPSIVDQLPLIRGLDSDVVREIIENPENELCNLDLDEFLRNVTAGSDQTKAG